LILVKILLNYPHETTAINPGLRLIQEMNLHTAFVALFRSLLIIVAAGLAPTFVSANDWLSHYVHQSAAEISAADSALGFVTSTRSSINLNGIWEIRKKGEVAWDSVFVPGAYDFEGVVEFRRTFVVDSSLVGKSLRLYALGINNRCSVFINGSFAARHSGGHTSFGIDISNEKIRTGAENEILITVESSLLPRSSLPLRHRSHFPFNYGGIFRDIFILAIPSVSIDDVHINKKFSDDYSKCSMTVEARIRNKGSEFLAVPLEWHVEVLDSSNNIIVHSQPIGLIFESSAARASATLEILNPKLWTPETPRLYRLSSYIFKKAELIDEINLPLGFCDFTVSGENFSLNGQPFEIKGFDWFENYGSRGPVANLSAIRSDIQRIKESGANTVRVVGLPPNPLFLAVCDELGLLVFEELPLQMVPDKFFAIPDFMALTRAYLESMLNRDAQHVSLAAWGFGTDLLTHLPTTAAALNELIAVVRKRSPLPTYLSFRILKKTESAPLVDFLVFDAYNQDEESVTATLNMPGGGKNNLPKVLSVGYPIFVSAAGGIYSWSSFDDNTPAAPGTVPPLVEAQRRQAEMIQRVLARMDSTGRVAGVLIHSYADWREARPNLLFAQRHFPEWHVSGVVTSDREKRLTYEIVRTFFLHEPHRPLTAPPLDIQNPIIYPLAGLSILLIFLFNLNRDNRFRGSLRRVFLYPHGFYMELRERRKVPFFQTMLLSFTIFMLLSIVVSSIVFRFRYDQMFNSILELFVAANSVKLIAIRLIWNPTFFVPAFFLILLVIYSILALFLKLLAFVFSENLPISQFYALMIWDSANFVWLLPIVPIYYRIINQTNWSAYAIWLVILFTFWTAIRMFRSVRVVYNMTLLNTLFMVFILAILILGGVWWYIDDRYAIFDYLPLYWQAL